MTARKDGRMRWWLNGRAPAFQAGNAGPIPVHRSMVGRPVISLQRTMSGAVGGVCIAYDGSLRYGGKGSPATTMLCWVRGRNHLFAKQAILTDPKVRILHTAPMGLPKLAPSASWCIARNSLSPCGQLPRGGSLYEGSGIRRLQFNSSGDCEAAGVYADVAQRQERGAPPRFRSPVRIRPSAPGRKA